MDTAHQNAPAEAPESGIRQPAPDGRPASACSPPFVDRQKVDAKRYDSTNPKWNQRGICIVVGQRRARCESGWMVKIMSKDGTYTELDSHWLSAENIETQQPRNEASGYE
jgi:hypothetical protein